MSTDTDTEFVDLDQQLVGSLRHDDGRTYRDFRRTLGPRWSRVAMDVALGYAALVATLIAVAAGYRYLPALTPLWILVGALSVGYWMAYLQLFIHEAAHYNLVPSRTWNDRIATVLIASWVGARIGDYRRIHFDHHRLHGETTDTENSYFNRLDARFIVESLFGIQAIRVLRLRQARTSARAADGPGDGKRRLPVMPAVALMLHAAIVALALQRGQWPLALAWVAGVALFFPFFGALRQLLEHRAADASGAVNYAAVRHGRISRMFEGGPFGSTFGAAGFTRHLLHHWDPQISYTNLPEVEKFLGGCDDTRAVSTSRTTYLSAFRLLYGR
jgi:fatty acid desaturase